MSDSVNDDNRSLLAAEYVLGTLDSDERTRAKVLLDVNPEFRAMVRIWERRLGELQLMVEPVEPDPKIWDRIRGKLKDIAPLAPAIPVSPVKTNGATADKKLADLMQGAQPFPAPPAADTKPMDSDTSEPEFGPTQPEPAGAGSKPVEPEPQAADFGGAGSSLPGLDRVEPLVLDRPSNEPRPDLIPRVSDRSRAWKSEQKEQKRQKEAAHTPRIGRWRAFAAVMTIIAAALAGLITAWRYIPDYLPALLRPAVVLNLATTFPQPAKKPAPPGSQFDE
jgi:anti-sigma-K factor RskA